MKNLVLSVFIALTKRNIETRTKNIAMTSISAIVFFMWNGAIARRKAAISDVFSEKNSFVNKKMTKTEKEPKSNAAILEANCVVPSQL